MTHPEVGCQDRDLELVGSHGPTQPMEKLRQLGSVGKGVCTCVRMNEQNKAVKVSEL